MNPRPRATVRRLPLTTILIPLLVALGCMNTATPPVQSASSGAPSGTGAGLAPGTSQQSAPTTATFVYPQNNSTNVDPLAPFQWTAVEGAAYTLNVGTTPGAIDVYTESGMLSNVTQRTVWGLWPGRVYYASLYVLLNGVWSQQNIRFQTTSPKNPGPATRAALYSTVASLTSQFR